MDVTSIARRPILLFLFTAISAPALGQVVGSPFFGGGVTAFEPEISTVSSGALLSAQASVSADLKYVTLTVQPQNSKLLALREFSFQTAIPGGGGVVGTPAVQQQPLNTAGNTGASGGGGATGGAAASAAAAGRSVSSAVRPARTLFDRPGITRILPPR